MWCVFSTSRTLSTCLHLTLPHSSTGFPNNRITTSNHQQGLILSLSFISYSESVCCFSRLVRNLHGSRYLCWAAPYRSLNNYRTSSRLIIPTVVEANLRSRSSAEDGKDCDLELQMLKFMEQSQKPTSFPSTEELIEAGRADLGQEILPKGRRLTVGWNVGSDSPPAAKKKGVQRAGPSPVRTRKRSKTKTGSFSLVDIQQTNPPTKPQKILGLTNSSQKEKSKYLKKKLATQQQIAHAPHNCGESDMPLDDLSNTCTPKSESMGSFTKSNAGGTVIQGEDPEKNVVQKQYFDPESNIEEGVSDSLEWINEMMDSRERWIQQAKLSSQKFDSSYTPNRPIMSVSARLRSIEAQLLTTRMALWSSRSNLQESPGSDMQESVHATEFAELLKASEALEFREDEIFQTQLQLRKTRAQMTALEGKMALEIKEAHKALDEKDKVLKETQQVLRKMKAVRIVWPYFASEVLLAGSYDGWTGQIKMEKSSAGVFVTPLRLFPGRYELKFIVDGQWKVDPGRPIVYNDAYENNLLVIS